MNPETVNTLQMKRPGALKTEVWNFFKSKKNVNYKIGLLSLSDQ